LKPWSSLRRVVCDAGTGLQAAIAQLREHRPRARPTPSRWRRAWMSSTPSGKPAALSGRCGAVRSGPGSGPRQPPGRWNESDGRAATRGARRGRPSRPGARRRRPSAGPRRPRRAGSGLSRP
jgi:hypothetical protein